MDDKKEKTREVAGGLSGDCFQLDNLRPNKIIVQPQILPFMDIHVHIQSNACAPLTLQWGLVDQKLGAVPNLAKRYKTSGLDREALDTIMSSGVGSMAVRDFGRLGTFPTALNANILNGDLKDRMEVKHKAYGMAIADTDEKLVARMKAERNSLRACFEKAFAQYFAGLEVVHMSTILPMDLSFAHYWGRFGTTIYLPRFDEDNDISGYYLHNECLPVMSLNDPALLPLPRMGIVPDYFKFIIMYDNDHTTFSRRGMLQENQISCIDFDSITPAQERAIESTKPYKHYLSIAQGETTENFEDYDRQIKSTKEAVLKYPLRMIAFFHFDPRRFLTGSVAEMPDLKVRMDSPIDKDGLKKQLQANHFYFIMDEEMKKYRPVKESESWVYDSALYFQEMFDSVKNRVIDHKNKKTDAEGLFWGYKMYPSLGYQPDDWESYPKLKEFYKYCADEGIPITSHCSSGGMAIADPFIYFKEAIKKQAALDLARQRTVAARLREKDEFIFNIQKPGLDKEGFALMTSDIADNEAFDENFLEYLMKSYAYVSESCLHPANWENVLMRYPKLKLNLAHFTGKETILDYFFKTGVMDQLANTVQGENKGWIKKLLEMIDSGKYPNLYTDLAYFDLHRYRGSDDGREIDGTRELTEVFGRNDFDLFVEAMVKLLGSHPALKRHILFGSDWLMVEMSYKSVGLYCMNLCEALRQVSLKVGYDVWYQFTVLNNLRFLGILDDNDRLFEDKLLQYAKNFGAALSHIAADSNPKKGSIEVIQGLDTKTSSERFSFLYDKIACRTGSKFTADFSFTPGAKREGLERTFMPVDSSSFTMYGKKRCEL